MVVCMSVMSCSLRRCRSSAGVARALVGSVCVGAVVCGHRRCRWSSVVATTPLLLLRRCLPSSIADPAAAVLLQDLELPVVELVREGAAAVDCATIEEGHTLVSVNQRLLKGLSVRDVMGILSNAASAVKVRGSAVHRVTVACARGGVKGRVRATRAAGVALLTAYRLRALSCSGVTRPRHVCAEIRADGWNGGGEHPGSGQLPRLQVHAVTTCSFTAQTASLLGFHASIAPTTFVCTVSTTMPQRRHCTRLHAARPLRGTVVDSFA